MELKNLFLPEQLEIVNIKSLGIIIPLYDEKRKYLICPICKNSLFESYNYCPWCGKKIDWEEKFVEYNKEDEE